MPLTLKINGKDGYDYKKEEFVKIPDQIVILEHSLNSIFKWEGIWTKPFLGRESRTEPEFRSYIQCMVVNDKDVDMNFVFGLTNKNYKEIADYISKSQTATTITHVNRKKRGPIVDETPTAELILYYMGQAKIPVEPCSSWHLSRLMAILGIAAVKSEPPTKMSTNEWLKKQSDLNKLRRAKLRTKG